MYSYYSMTLLPCSKKTFIYRIYPNTPNSLLPSSAITQADGAAFIQLEALLPKSLLASLMPHFQVLPVPLAVPFQSPLLCSLPPHSPLGLGLKLHFLFNLLIFHKKYPLFSLLNFPVNIPLSSKCISSEQTTSLNFRPILSTNTIWTLQVFLLIISRSNVQK